MGLDLFSYGWLSGYASKPTNSHLYYYGICTSTSCHALPDESPFSKYLFQSLSKFVEAHLVSKLLYHRWLLYCLPTVTDILNC